LEGTKTGPRRQIGGGREAFDMSTDAATLVAAQAMPSIARDESAPVFREPWEAQAFALALSLHERGVFAWNEWATALSAEIKKAQATPLVKDRIAALAGETLDMPLADIKPFLKAEIARWADVVKRANIEVQ